MEIALRPKGNLLQECHREKEQEEEDGMGIVLKAHRGRRLPVQRLECRILSRCGWRLARRSVNTINATRNRARGHAAASARPGLAAPPAGPPAALPAPAARGCITSAGCITSGACSVSHDAIIPGRGGWARGGRRNRRVLGWAERRVAVIVALDPQLCARWIERAIFILRREAMLVKLILLIHGDPLVGGKVTGCLSRRAAAAGMHAGGQVGEGAPRHLPYGPSRDNIVWSDSMEAGVQALRKRARAGEVRMQHVLARRLVESANSEDHDEALRWMESAVDAGHTDAIDTLCEWCEKPRPLLSRDQRQRLVHLVEQAADRDSASAQVCLARLHASGNGVEMDLARTVHWYTKAAEQGQAQAQFNLGYCFDNGRGVEHDLARAVHWYTKAAEQGHAQAQFNLGDCFENGWGVEQDLAQARHWYTKAAEQGDPKYLLAAAQVFAIRHGENAGTGSSSAALVEPDHVTAVHYAARSASQDWSRAADAREFVNIRAHLKDVARAVCMACGTLATSVPKMKRCGGCQVAFFCSPACMKTMWRVHKQHCASWRSVARGGE